MEIRYGSPKYFTLINEARLLACEENIDFDNQTKKILIEMFKKETRNKD